MLNATFKMANGVCWYQLSYIICITAFLYHLHRNEYKLHSTLGTEYIQTMHLQILARFDTTNFDLIMMLH